jgi:hypothetical protein
MAKHRKHSRRHGRGGFKAFGLAFPKISDIKKNAKGMDILMGAGLGVLGIVGIKVAYNKLTAKTADGKDGIVKEIPGVLAQFSPLIGGVLAGAAAYALYHKKSAAKATGWLIGSIGTGVAITAATYVNEMDWVKKNTTFAVPADASEAAKRVAAGGFGLLTRGAAGSNYGLLQRDNMARLSQMAMGDMGAAEELEALLS